MIKTVLSIRTATTAACLFFKTKMGLASDQWLTSICYFYAIIQAAATGADCIASISSLVYNLSKPVNISTGEKKSKHFHLSDDARPYRATKGLHDMYTRTFMLFHKWELVLLSSAAEMLLGRTSINQRVFKEGIIIGDLKRSFSPLIDSSVEVVPGRQFPARLLSTVDINVAVRSQRWHSETAE